MINCEGIVDALCADLVAQQDHKSAGFTHVSKALPVNTLNNDVLYIGINKQGFACVFNYLSITTFNFSTDSNCYYITAEERIHQMSDLDWWKILKKPTKNDSLKKAAKEVLGKRRSRLVVMAWFGSSPKSGAKWLCRCDCGYYVIRHSSFLKKLDKFDACLECRFVIQKRRHNHWLATGKDLTEEYFA